MKKAKNKNKQVERVVCRLIFSYNSYRRVSYGFPCERRTMRRHKTTLSKSIDLTPQIAKVAVLTDETNAPKITGTGVEDVSY